MDLFYRLNELNLNITPLKTPPGRVVVTSNVKVARGLPHRPGAGPVG